MSPSDDLYYVVVPNQGYQEANTLEDARAIAKLFQKEKDVSLVRIVDALDKTLRGYRLMFQWERDDSGKWKTRLPQGRVWI